MVLSHRSWKAAISQSRQGWARWKNNLPRQKAVSDIILNALFAFLIVPLFKFPYIQAQPVTFHLLSRTKSCAVAFRLLASSTFFIVFEILHRNQKKKKEEIYQPCPGSLDMTSWRAVMGFKLCWSVIKIWLEMKGAREEKKNLEQKFCFACAFQDLHPSPPPTPSRWNERHVF